MPGDCFSTGPHACKAELLQTHHGTKILHILLHDDVVKKVQMFSIKTDVMLPHHMRGEGVAAPQDGSGDTLVYVQLSRREELIQRSSPSQEIFSAKESSVTKVPIKPCDSKTIVNSPRSSSGKPAQLHPLLGLREILMTSGTYWRPFSLLENQTLLYSI